LPHVIHGARPASRAPLGATRRLLLLGALAAAVLAAPLAPQVASPARAGSCGTNWHSRTQAPDTIKVLRSRTGKVETVDFRQYVGIVMASGEFPAWLPEAVLEVGATAVKQFAWYYALEGHHRSGYRTNRGVCYDVRDDTMDQLFRPEKATPKRNQLAAIDATWDLTLRKNGRFFLTGYRAGTEGRCARDADGWRIYTRSAQDCAKDKGWSRQQIQEAYYRSHVDFVWSDPDPASGRKRDHRDPVVSTPRLTLVAGPRLDRHTGRISWKGTDTGGSGIARYRLQRQVGRGRWQDVRLQGLRATSFRFRMPVVRVVRFRVRAIDADGNSSAWNTGPAISGRVVQSEEVALSRGWRTLAKPAASGGSSRYTVRKGAQATIHFRGRSIAIVAPTGPGRGRAHIILDGKRVGVVDLRAADHNQRRLVWARSWAKGGRHTLRVVTLGIDGRRRFDLDAFLIVR
jgi:hypothetical protein